jgi:hypothetical protein
MIISTLRFAQLGTNSRFFLRQKHVVSTRERESAIMPAREQKELTRHFRPRVEARNDMHMVRLLQLRGL